MRSNWPNAVALALLATAAACSAPKDETSAADAGSSAAVAAADPRPPAFVQCKVCHAVTAGTNGVGPSLSGVVGRKAGTVPGFAYSDAMKGSGLTWDEATLDPYLTAPMKVVPGTKMTYAGQPDAAMRKEVIEYLKTLK